jgi:hypothetical protein
MVHFIGISIPILQLCRMNTGHFTRSIGVAIGVMAGAAVSVFGQTFDDTTHLKIAYRLETAASVRDSGPAILVNFSPASDVHVNARPAVTCTFDPESPFQIKGKPIVSVDEAQNRVDTSVPVKFRIRPRKGTKPGTYACKGVVSFLYCSDIEGTCRRGKDSFSILIEVR